VVNGPGESKMANLGISLPGTGEIPVAPVFENGKKTITLKGDNIGNEFKKIIDVYIDNNYPKKS
jgi:(E)-4-hydroxy-3-methylbut-2-enyl-diphosphate synthase